MQCSGPSAPHILKWRGVQIQFILDVVLRTSDLLPLLSEIVVCWGVQITFILYVVLGTFGPSHSKTVGCLEYIYFRYSAWIFQPLAFCVADAGVFRLVLFYMQCSGPSAPCTVKSGVFRFDLFMMQCSGPLAPCFLKQWMFKSSSDIFECFKILSFV